MMHRVVAVILLAGTVCVSAAPKCHGRPRKYNGKDCATTTHYHDGFKGACGCGPASGNSMFDWNRYSYVAAANQNLFDSNRKTWCGQTCGRCVKLTTTGGYIDGQGSSPGEGHSHVFMITNLCPNVAPNLSWCNQSPANSYLNQYQYGWHFDLENGAKQITDRLRWNNPEVTWEFVDCNSAHSRDQSTPSSNMFHGCQCG